MRKIITLAGLLVIAANAAAAEDACPSLGDENKLQEIIEIGLCRNPTTKMGYLALEASRLQKNKGYSSYLPEISASAGISASHAGGGPGNWGKSASISASYLIFDFGRRFSELSRLAAVWRATGLDYDRSIQEYVYSVVGAYYGLLSADAELKVSNDLLAIAETAKATADKKYGAGAVAKADVLKADTTLAAKRTDLQRAKGNREIAVAQLLKLLSLPQGTDIKIADMPAEFGGSAEVREVRELLETAKKNRPDLLAAAARTDAEWWSRNMTFMSHLPTIRASGQISYDLDTDIKNTTIGISASMPIFSGFSKIYDDRAAMLNYERAKENEIAKSDDVALSVWTAFHNYITAQGVLKSTDIQVKSAMESEKVVAGMYKVGRSTMLDWQTSQAELASAQRQNASAKYDLFVRRAALAMAVGDLKSPPREQDRSQ